jgi:adenosine kinase
VKILLSGSIAFDRIMLFHGKFADVIQPDKLHVLSLSVLLKELEDSPGGVAANIAYSLALLGEEPMLYGSVGYDAAAYMNRLGSLGVNTEYVHYSSLHTASFTVMTDMAHCQVGGFYPGAMGDAEHLNFSHFKDQDYFFAVSPHDPKQMAKQVAEAKQHNLRLFYDVGQQAINIADEDIQAGIEAAEVLIVNDYEMGVLVEKTGWSQKEIIGKVKVCIVTLGGKGCEVYQNGNTKAQKVLAAAITQVIDPTGAGDAFRAGFLYGYVRGWSAVEAAQLGAVTAAFSVEQKGTQSHTCTKDNIEERYRANFGNFPSYVE